MTVKTSPTAKTEAPVAQPEAPQSIALVLNKRTKRYVRVVDNKLYESGVIYRFTPEKAAEVQMDTDERGYPMFVPYKAEVKVERTLVTSTGLREDVVTAPVKEVVAAPVKAIVIEDDDPEMAARLKGIDAGSEDGVVV